jgi:hypothetical protein
MSKNRRDPLKNVPNLRIIWQRKEAAVRINRVTIELCLALCLLVSTS